jgi:hypothetical protein
VPLHIRVATCAQWSTQRWSLRTRAMFLFFLRPFSTRVTQTSTTIRGGTHTHAHKNVRHAPNAPLRSLLDVTCTPVPCRVFYLQYSPRPILRPSLVTNDYASATTSAASDADLSCGSAGVDLCEVQSQSPRPTKKQKIGDSNVALSLTSRDSNEIGDPLWFAVDCGDTC